MDASIFKKHILQVSEFSLQDVEEMEFFSDQELEEYQRELEKDSGNLNDWDHIRAVLTFKQKIDELEMGRKNVGNK